jgi:uncharacterized protein (DUF488 family)
VSGPVLGTIGYQGKVVDDLVEILHTHDIEVLVDVRLNAMSRKAGFSKRRLGEALAAAGIDYVHEPRLGNPRENRRGFAAGHPENRKLYLERLNGESRVAYDDLVRLVPTRPAALLCYEADHRVCHRTCITEQLAVDVPGLVVVNL